MAHVPMSHERGNEETDCNVVSHHVHDDGYTNLCRVANYTVFSEFFRFLLKIPCFRVYSVNSDYL